MRIFVTSDHHFGQRNFYEFNYKYGHIMRPNFSCAEEFTEYYVDRYNKLIKAGDLVYFLGDVGSGSVLPRLNGQKVLIMGNHDKISALKPYFIKIASSRVLDDKYLLTHIPVHPSELRGLINIHGHSHQKSIDDKRYVNACFDNQNLIAIRVYTDLNLLTHNF